MTRDEVIREVVDATAAFVSTSSAKSPPGVDERKIIVASTTDWERLKNAVETYLDSEEE